MINFFLYDKNMKKIFIIQLIITSLFCTSCNKYEDKELAIVMKNNSLKIAQFTDLHFGTEGLQYHNPNINKTISFMNKVVESTSPDLIVLSGDIIMGTGIDGISQIIEIMDNYQTPWTYLFGNHDAESFSMNYSKKDVSNYLSTSSSKYLLYKNGYIELGNENRYGNFFIKVVDEQNKLIGAIINMDSGVYDYSLDSYQKITPSQTNWYIEEIDKLNDIYLKQSSNSNTIIPTILFNHMPPREFHQIYSQINNGGEGEIIIPQRRLNDNNKSFFQTVIEKESTKAFFVGHYHIMKYQVKYGNLTFGFAPHTMGNSLTYVYDFNEQFNFTTIEATNN